jgi:hypothetical protein
VENPVTTTAGGGRIFAVVIRCKFSVTMHFMQSVPKAKEKIRDRARYEWLRQWMVKNEIHKYKGETYRELRTWLLRNGLVQHIKLSVFEGEPFVMGTDFYGVTFEAALDAARTGCRENRSWR